MSRKPRHALAAVAVAFGAAAVPTVAFAADDTVSVAGAEPGVFVIAAPVIMFVVSVLIPILNGLLTKYSTPPQVKAVLTIVLNAVAAFVVTATQADGTAVFSNATLMTFIFGTVVSVTSYLGLWKPVGLTSSNDAQDQPGKLAAVGVHD